MCCRDNSRGVEIVAQRRPDAGNLVRGHLLALAAAADDNSPVRAFLGDEPADFRANGRIVHGLFAVGPTIVEIMTHSHDGLDQVLFERKPGMVGADRDAHGMRL